MVLDLFSGRPTRMGGGRTDIRRNSSAARSVTPASRASGGNASRRRPVRGRDATVRASTTDDRRLFTECVAQVQKNLKTHLTSPSALHTLGSYYTQVEPYIEDRPFCVSLSYATFLFHLQMARISVQDVEVYVQLIANVLSQLTENELLTHPFVHEVLHDHVFGLPSPTCRGGAHCVVLVPPQQYRGFAVLTTSLLALDVLPVDIVYQFQDKLEHYCTVDSPIVANRALALLVQTVSQVRMDEQITALQYVLKTKPVRMNVDFLLACYERLKRAVLNPAHGPSFGRALSIHTSELFLRFRSPIRREYVERFLYPSLCHPDMENFLAIEATRNHLFTELLALCTPGMTAASPYYMCLCALLQRAMDNEIDGALEMVNLMNCRMPHAAYFMSALAVDSHMSVSMFAKTVIALARGAGLAMTGRDVPDEVATSISKARTSVYNVLFGLREVVRSCSITASRRASEMLKALRVAMPMKTIDALGKLSSEAFDGQCDITVDPQLLCAELAMVLHQEHMEDAVESAVDYFRDVTTLCQFCGMQRSGTLVCPVSGTVHVTGQTSVSRVLSTLAECAGAKTLEDRLVRYLRDPNTQMESAVHFLVFHIIANAGQHRNTLFVGLEPYIRSTLMALVSADRSGTARALVTSEQKANVLMLHVKLVMLLTGSIDPSYLQSIVTVFTELKLRSNHDALAMWYMSNLLLRNCKGNLELLPTDPKENSYCVDFPGCAPTSATCADNAQLVLKLLDRAHHFSPEMRKVVGCCVCKMIQDFNVQSPNIIGSLLSNFGFVPVALEPLSEFAMPVGAGSTFWSFFLKQMRSSAPARTAFMTGLAKSVASRFRIATPVDAVTPYGADTTAPVFAVMMFEAMKRNPPLARVVLFMVSNWMKQANHTPGKFVCLVYICVQLVTVVMERGSGPGAVEMEAETPQDQHQFDECVQKACRVLHSQESRLERLLPVVRRDNLEFFRLTKRLQRKVRRTVAIANGEDVSTMDNESGYDSDAYDTYVRQQHQQRSNDTLALNELQNAEDDSVFDDQGTRAEHSIDVDVDADEDTGAGPDDSDEHVWGGRGSRAEDDDDLSALLDQFQRRQEQQQMRRPLRPLSANTSDKDGLRRGTAAPKSIRSTAAYADADMPSSVSHQYGEDDGVSGEMPGPRPRSRSRGVQTDGDDTVSHAGSSRSHTRRTDRSLTTPAHRNAGTSPIGEESEREPDDSEVASSAGRPSAWHEPDLSDLVPGGDATPIDDTGVPALQATNTDGVLLPSGLVLEYLRTHQNRGSLLHEMQQLGQVAGAPAGPGGNQRVMQHVANFVRHTEHPAANEFSAVQTVAMDARANNYSQPHEDPSRMAPSRNVTAAVRIHATNTSTTARQGDVVDGERPITPVSYSRAGAEPGMEAGKQRRMEGLATSASAHTQSVPPSSASNLRGANFFMQQNNGENVQSALQDIQSMRRQHENQQVLVNQAGPYATTPMSSSVSDSHTATTESAPSARHTAPPRMTPVSGGMGTDGGLPETTPYGQMVIPACFVEQKNDTAVRELRQAMGAHNPNDSALSTSGKRRIQGSGATPADGQPPQQENSGAWWTEMSTAPMPTYAQDPQYSMELF